jgi:hypothetical protein
MSFRLYSEILQEFDEAETKADKIGVLRKYDQPRFREFFWYVFSPQVKFDVSVPEYKASMDPAGLSMTYLSMEIPKLYRFIENHPKRVPGLNGKKQANLLIGILESLHKDEAEILVKLIKKDLKVKYLTENLVKEAFPGINL